MRSGSSPPVYTRRPAGLPCGSYPNSGTPLPALIPRESSIGRSRPYPARSADRREPIWPGRSRRGQRRGWTARRASQAAGSLRWTARLCCCLPPPALMGREFGVPTRHPRRRASQLKPNGKLTERAGPPPRGPLDRAPTGTKLPASYSPPTKFGTSVLHDDHTTMPGMRFCTMITPPLPGVSCWLCPTCATGAACAVVLVESIATTPEPWKKAKGERRGTWMSPREWVDRKGRWDNCTTGAGYLRQSRTRESVREYGKYREKI